MIGFCDPELRAQVYLEVAGRARQSTDLTLVRRGLLRVVWFRDGALFERVIEIAADRTATVESRVVAFVALARIRNPTASPSYEGFVGGLDDLGLPRGHCSMRSMHAVEPRPGVTPMPADFPERIEAVTRTVARDTTAPPDVRSAAACT